MDADGRACYPADSKTSPTVITLPEKLKAGRIASNDSQAIITDTDGHIWAWKPNEAPTRADNGSQQYTQAAETGNRITALDRQGSLYNWNLDEQDQPFTRSLNYTVDQTLTRDTNPKAGPTVSFNATEEDPTPDPQQVDYPYRRVQRPSPDPTRKGYSSTDGSLTKSPTTSAHPSPRTSPSTPTGRRKNRISSGPSAQTRAVNSADSKPPSPRQQLRVASNSTKWADHRAPIVFP